LRVRNTSISFRRLRTRWCSKGGSGGEVESRASRRRISEWRAAAFSGVRATLRQANGWQPPWSGQAFAAAVFGALAEGFGVVVDAGDVVAGIDAWVVLLHDAQQSVLVEHDFALVMGSIAEFVQSLGGFGRGRTAEVVMVVPDRPVRR
jgi:hypothetical protein